MRLQTLIIGYAVALAAALPSRAATNEEAPKEEPVQIVQVAPGGVQPLLPKLWQSRDPVTWKLDRGGVWASLGHSAIVLAITPDGPPGRAARITMTVYRVEAFDAATKSPAKVTPLAEKVFAVSELAGAKGKTVSYNFYLPGDTFRYCLMSVLRFDLAGNGDARAFAAASARVAVIEFLEDKGTVPTTSKWIEPTHKPDASWAKRERLLAPWTDGRPVGGRFESAATPLFGPAAPRAIDAPEVKEPKLGANPEGEADAAVDLEDKAEK